MKLRELFFHWGDNEVEHGPADPKSRSGKQSNPIKDENPHHDDDEPLNRPPQMGAEVFEVIAEGHARIGEHVFGVGLFLEFEHG